MQSEVKFFHARNCVQMTFLESNLILPNLHDGQILF